MPSRENPVVKSCMSMLEILRVPHFRNNTGAAKLIGAGGKPRPVAFGAPGWPDILGTLPDGRFLGVECKAPADPVLKKRAGKLSDEQREVIALLRRANALVIVAHSHAEMCDALKAAGYFREVLA